MSGEIGRYLNARRNAVEAFNLRQETTKQIQHMEERNAQDGRTLRNRVIFKIVQVRLHIRLFKITK